MKLELTLRDKLIKRAVLMSVVDLIREAKRLNSLELKEAGAESKIMSLTRNSFDYLINKIEDLENEGE